MERIIRPTNGKEQKIKWKETSELREEGEEKSKRERELG
jgi:hypothetical protein